MAIEIHYKSSDDLLPAKVITIRPVISQSHPKPFLCRRHITAESLGFNVFRFTDTLSGSDIPRHEISPFDDVSPTPT
jgi:hypothetical protein